MFMLTLSWNVRGLRNGEKMRVVRNLVVSHKPIFLFIQESKMGKFDNRVISSLGGSLLIRGICVEANSTVGGLITLWNEDFFICKSLHHQ